MTSESPFNGPEYPVELTAQPAPDLTFETSFWGDCCNTYEEESKHFVYAKLMGLARVGHGQQLGNYGWDANNKRVLDIGGGPTSMLLRCVYLKAESKVVDPILFPFWVRDRYLARGIYFDQASGEDIALHDFDECWIYNVLQHAVDPAKVITNARKAAPVLRIFEWIDIPAYEGHPHMLTEAKLNEWTGGKGYVCQINGENGCWGRSWSGVF